MKRKQIEKIPYITVPGVLQERKAAYVAVTAWKNIGKERHIILEVYENRKKCLTVPVVRYVATKKDWGVFYPDSGAWTREGIASGPYQYNYGPCWYGQEIRDHRLYVEMDKVNRLYSEKDLDRIRNYFHVGEEDFWRYWWSHFEDNEKAIKRSIAERRYRKRQERLQERIANTPELPKEEILTWADEALFHKAHYLYYRKKGSRAEICCSKCGGIHEGKWKAGESYMAQFESLIQEPVKGRVGRCKLCGALGEYKPQGEAKSSYRKEKYIFTADKYKESSVVIRYVNLQKEWVLEEFAGEKRTEMLRAYEKLSGIEVARAYFEPGKKVQTDYHKCSSFNGEDFWDDCNLYGNANIYISKAELYPEIGEKLKGTSLQYSALELYADKVGDVNAIDYLERYQQMPQIEMLVKAGLYKVVGELVRSHCGIIANDRASRPEEFLGIRKEDLKLLIREEGDIDLLTIMQAEKRMGRNWSEEQLLALREIGFDAAKIEMVTEIMTLQKALNLIAKYAGCEYGTGCTRAENRLRHMATTYFDYLQMRKEQGYDLTNTVYQRPRNLEIAHNSMVEERNQKEIEKREKEVEEEYPQIRKRYRKLREKYYYEDDTYLIRPAKSAEEIVREGRTLHHCVGRDVYLKSHSEGISTILFLRYKDEKDIPYITVEIKNDRIAQWYGAYDKKPDEKNMQRWLDNYITRLRCAGENPEREEIRVMVG